MSISTLIRPKKVLGTDTVVRKDEPSLKIADRPAFTVPPVMSPREEIMMLAERVVNKYGTAIIGKPYYVDHYDRPGCLVGAILMELGVKPEQFRVYHDGQFVNEAKIRWVASHTPIVPERLHSQLPLLTQLQQANDCGFGWGYILDEAKIAA